MNIRTIDISAVADGLSAAALTGFVPGARVTAKISKVPPRVHAAASKISKLPPRVRAATPKVSKVPARHHSGTSKISKREAGRG